MVQDSKVTFHIHQNEAEMLQISINYRHWLHRKLSLWEFRVQPVTQTFFKITICVSVNVTKRHIWSLVGCRHAHSLLHTIYSMKYSYVVFCIAVINASTPVENDHQFADTIFKCIFVKEKFCILIYLKFHWTLFLRVQLTKTQHWSNILAEWGKIDPKITIIKDNSRQ